MTKAKSNREAGAKPASAPAPNTAGPEAGETAATAGISNESEGVAIVVGAAPERPTLADLGGPVVTAGAELGEGIAQVTLPVEGSALIGGTAGDQEDQSGDLGGRIIMVRSTSDRGRRRAGMAFGPIPTPVRVEDLSDEQIADLIGDPQLIISSDD